MSKQLDRNAPCHCGSGKKYKNCHMKGDQKGGTSSQAKLIGLIAAALLGIFIIIQAFKGDNSSPIQCPPGQVWSDVHQHCH